MSEGPRPSTPSRLDPWQVMQLRVYSSRPASTAFDGLPVGSSAALAPGARAE
jgi:hypothetical protein